MLQRAEQAAAAGERLLAGVTQLAVAFDRTVELAAPGALHAELKQALTAGAARCSVALEMQASTARVLAEHASLQERLEAALQVESSSTAQMERLRQQLDHAGSECARLDKARPPSGCHAWCRRSRSVRACLGQLVTKSSVCYLPGVAPSSSTRTGAGLCMQARAEAEADAARVRGVLNARGASYASAASSAAHAGRRRALARCLRLAARAHTAQARALALRLCGRHSPSHFTCLSHWVACPTVLHESSWPQNGCPLVCLQTASASVQPNGMWTLDKMLKRAGGQPRDCQRRGPASDSTVDESRLVAASPHL
jgi:hypothetical protein